MGAFLAADFPLLNVSNAPCLQVGFRRGWDSGTGKKLGSEEAKQVVADGLIHAAKQLLLKHETGMRRFMREICAIPSVDGEIGAVLARVEQEAVALGYDQIFIDSIGCLVACMGRGSDTFLYDAHLDTVGIGDPTDWNHDPFRGWIDKDVLYARGACDTKGCIPGMIYGIAMARELGLLEGKRLIYYGSLEEQCDGQAPRVLVEVDGLRPDYVVIGEPTDMNIYHGQRGRVEIGLKATGRSAHASMPELGENPLYMLAQVLNRLEAHNESLGQNLDPIAAGSIAATDLHCTTASINAVPSEATLFLDRRLGLDEELQTVLEQVRTCIPEELQGKMAIEILRHDAPSYNGFSYPVEKVFPAWRLPEEDPFLQAGLKTHAAVYGRPGRLGLWPASTNGTYWMGTAGIPSLGFGPGSLNHAHGLDEQVQLRDVVQAALFYTFLPAYLPSTSPGE